MFFTCIYKYEFNKNLSKTNDKNKLRKVAIILSVNYYNTVSYKLDNKIDTQRASQKYMDTANHVNLWQPYSGHRLLK